MKKINTIFIIIGIICFMIAGYILVDKILYKEDKITINEEKELKEVNNYLAKVGSPLGFLIVKEGINNQDENGNYKLIYNKNYLEKYENKQLFTMEYILSYDDNKALFTVLSAGDYSIVKDTPTNDFTLAYLDYDTFNKYYNELFNTNFDINNKDVKIGNTKYDNSNVYFDNRHPGSNGVYVSMITSDSVEYKDNNYVASVKVTYSTRLAELTSSDSSSGIITYTKDNNNNIIIKEFILEN